MFELCWYLGLRFSEAKQIRKRDIKGNTLKVRRNKTNTVDVLEYIPPRVIELLESETDPIFSIKVSDATLSHMLRDACERAGIEYGRDAPDGVTFHRLRHSFISRITRCLLSSPPAVFIAGEERTLPA